MIKRFFYSIELFIDNLFVDKARPYPTDFLFEMKDSISIKKIFSCHPDNENTPLSVGEESIVELDSPIWLRSAISALVDGEYKTLTGRVLVILKQKDGYFLIKTRNSKYLIKKR